MATRESDHIKTTLLHEAVRRLVDTFQPERIYLFGSQPRADARSDSDFDLMVIVPTSDLPQYRRAQDAYRALWGVRLDMDVLIWTVDEFDQQVPLASSLPAAIIREGELLYAA